MLGELKVLETYIHTLSCLGNGLVYYGITLIPPSSLIEFKKIIASKGEYGLDDDPAEITPAEAILYKDSILAAIAKENRFFENDRGLAVYIHDETLNKKGV